MRSAMRTVEKRWLIRMAIFSSVSWRNCWKTWYSFSASSAAVGSSRTRMSHEPPAEGVLLALPAGKVAALGEPPSENRLVAFRQGGDDRVGAALDGRGFDARSVAEGLDSSRGAGL